MEIERRAVEFRADASGVLTGVLIPYDKPSDIAGLFSETFRPGSMRWDSPLVNRQHDRTKTLARLGAGLELTDGADALRAVIVLPDTTEGRDTKTLVQAGILRGLSAEFRTIRDEWKTEAEREILEAELLGLGIVDDPAHDGATIDEVRALFDRLGPVALGRNRKTWWL